MDTTHSTDIDSHVALCMASKNSPGQNRAAAKNPLLEKQVIQYSSVQAISIEHGGNINVLGVNEVITHSRYHADPDSFRYFVSQRTGKKIY